MSLGVSYCCVASYSGSVWEEKGLVAIGRLLMLVCYGSVLAPIVDWNIRFRSSSMQ
jgi:hypothetical protein